MDSNWISIIRTNSTHPDFIALVKLLDADLALRDGDDHGYYAQYNKIDTIKRAIVAYVEGIPAGCGALKEFDHQSMEVKRMFTVPEFRGRGVASYILSELEKWAVE